MSEESCTKSVLSPGTAMGNRNIQKAQPMSGFTSGALAGTWQELHAWLSPAPIGCQPLK